MKKILILFAHPALEKSRVNARISPDLSELEGVTVHDLYESYPEFDIDVAHEKKMVEDHDVIVFHHPLFWYSTPAILKEWQDLVLEHGWAYGSTGNALRGKVFFNIITAGGREEAYRIDGYNGHTLRQLLAPIEQTSRLCKMVFLPPFVIYGTHSIDADRVGSERTILVQILKAIRDDDIDYAGLNVVPSLNEYFHKTMSSQ